MLRTEEVHLVRPFDAAVRPCDPRLFLPFRVSVSIERAAGPRLLWPRLTSAAPSARLAAVLARGQDGRSLRVRRATFLPSTRRIYATSVRMTSGFRSMRPLAHRDDASCDSCTSGQEFAFRFLRIPPRGGHPYGSANPNYSWRWVAGRGWQPASAAGVGEESRGVADPETPFPPNRPCRGGGEVRDCGRAYPVSEAAACRKARTASATCR